MFFYVTSNKFKYHLDIYNLADSKNEKWLRQAAEWAENKWGYIRNFPGISYRERVIQQLQENFFIVTYANQPIGMFALLDQNGIKNEKNKELMYFYVDESFRGLGVGSRMMDMVKEICRRQNSDMIILDTLNPSLNRFYEKNGAKIVCEGQLLGHPTTLMRI